MKAALLQKKKKSGLPHRFLGKENPQIPLVTLSECLKFNGRQIIYFQKIQIDLKCYFRTLNFCHKLISWFRLWGGREPWISISLLNWIKKNLGKALVKELETLFSTFWGFFFFLSSSENLVSWRPTLIFFLFPSSKVPVTSKHLRKR